MNTRPVDHCYDKTEFAERIREIHMTGTTIVIMMISRAACIWEAGNSASDPLPSQLFVPKLLPPA